MKTKMRMMIMLSEEYMLELNYIFDFDQEKINRWFRRANADLRGYSPEELIVLDREDEVISYLSDLI